MAKVTLQLLQKEYGFEATDKSNIRVRYDNAVSDGGKEFGISPMEGLLMSLGSCTGIDVALILSKKRQVIASFEIIVEGHRASGSIPALWQKAHITFILNGDIEEAKAERAIELSLNNYCPVAMTLRRAGCDITWTLELGI